MLLVSIGLFRTRTGPRWVPALLWAFLALEFGGSDVSEFASYAGVLCLLVAYATLARFVARTDAAVWGAQPKARGQAVAAPA